MTSNASESRSTSAGARVTVNSFNGNVDYGNDDSDWARDLAHDAASWGVPSSLGREEIYIARGATITSNCFNGNVNSFNGARNLGNSGGGNDHGPTWSWKMPSFPSTGQGPHIRQNVCNGNVNSFNYNSFNSRNSNRPTKNSNNANINSFKTTVNSNNVVNSFNSFTTSGTTGSGSQPTSKTGKPTGQKKQAGQTFHYYDNSSPDIDFVAFQRGMEDFGRQMQAMGRQLQATHGGSSSTPIIIPTPPFVNETLGNVAAMTAGIAADVASAAQDARTPTSTLSTASESSSVTSATTTSKEDELPGYAEVVNADRQAQSQTAIAGRKPTAGLPMPATSSFADAAYNVTASGACTPAKQTRNPQKKSGGRWKAPFRRVYIFIRKMCGRH